MFFASMNIAILGSTGSIGTQALDIISRFPEKFKLNALTANKNIELLEKQIKQFKPEIVAVMDEVKAEELQKKVDIEVVKGLAGLNKVATYDKIDTVLNSLVGSIGIMPTIKAIENKKRILLANKESLVVAGKLIMDELKKSNVNLIPIDSEHSAIFQCLQGEDYKSIKKIILTCSGGPFRGKKQEELKAVSVKDVLKHPTWQMGNKITVDSATLMNKGFEVIEAKWLFDLDLDKIEIIVHPQSIIHSFVEFVDGSIKAQLSYPNMKIPINYALHYPNRVSFNDEKKTELINLNFEKPDLVNFPCLNYAYEAAKTGHSMPCVLNAANEIAVNAFLSEKISFLNIPQIIKTMMDQHLLVKDPSLDDILALDKKIRQETQKLIGDLD